MGAAQIIVIVLLALATGVTLALHGKPRPSYNALVGILGAAMWSGLLYWGGFFG